MLPIGAASPAGGQCSFSASEGVALWAPGCEIEFADPFSDEFVPTAWVQGTSQASVITSAALTALMSYQPTLTVAQAENDLLAGAGPSHQLNVAAAFELAGLGAIVEQGDAAIPPRTTTARRRRAAAAGGRTARRAAGDDEASSCKHQERELVSPKTPPPAHHAPCGRPRALARALRQGQGTLGSANPSSRLLAGVRATRASG